MKPRDIEDAVFELEQVRIVIRAGSREDLEDFNFQRKAAGNSSITEWLETRILPIVNGNEVVVINGRGEIPHGRTRMQNLRDSYAV